MMMKTPATRTDLINICPTFSRAKWDRGVALAFALFVLLLPVDSHAARLAPPKVAPVVHAGIRYTAPNNNGRRAYVRAQTETTRETLWEVTVFRNFIIPFIEEDVQHLYIETLELRGGELFATDENGSVYRIDLKTRRVRR
jgi:hypothetical protein